MRSVGRSRPIALCRPGRRLHRRSLRPRAEGPLRLVYVRCSSRHQCVQGRYLRSRRSAAGAAAAGNRLPQGPIISELSPDGARVAFFSGRSGEFELWVGDPDGSNAVQLTSLNSAPGFARWSPDGETLAFHSDPEGHPDVLAIPPGGAFRISDAWPIAAGRFQVSRGMADGSTSPDPNVEPNRRIRKIPASGGTPTRVTDDGGDVPIESYDGRRPVLSGRRRDAERVVAAAVGRWRHDQGARRRRSTPPTTWSSTASTTRSGHRWTGRVLPDRQVRARRDCSISTLQRGRSTTMIPRLGTVALGLSASRDGRTIFFTRVDSSADELMLVENFR